MTTYIRNEITTDAKNREAVDYYLDTICKSWSYMKLTADEKNRFEKIMTIAFRSDMKHSVVSLHGTAEQRRKQVDMMYFSFLEALGFDGGLWRSEDKEGEQ